uniref:Secreted protein n=1 Tax=Strongyloides papillosus TaxID=174720 RepID=A0A0N5CIJ8_STREA
MFPKISLVGLFFFILPLILASDTGNQKEDAFHNCNNYQENDSFDLSVSEKCNMTDTNIELNVFQEIASTTDWRHDVSPLAYT